jgi:Cu-Zn family superoxide dismutase
MKAAFILATCALLLAACAATSELQGASAVAKLSAKGGNQARGEIRFTQVGSRVRIEGEVTGLAPGPKGMHVHEYGDCSATDGTSAGGHFDPREPKNWSTRHGGPYAVQSHAGDLGNIVADQHGRAVFKMTVGGIAVERGGPIGIIGRALVVHLQEDDLKTDPAGNAGGRAACGVIEF